MSPNPFSFRRLTPCCSLLYLFTLALAATAQEQQQQPEGSLLGNSPTLDLSQKRTGATRGPNYNACDPSDLQSGACEGYGSATPDAGSGPARTRPHELIRSPESNASSPFTGWKAADDLHSQDLIEDLPTEFQKFVETSTGQLLPIFGASLFNRVPSTFAPLDAAPVGQDYVIGPGDELNVRIWGKIITEQRLTVDRTGDIFIPQVGRISVAGLHFSELTGAIKTSISRVFRDFDISVNLGQLRSIQVFVVGYARRPGTYTVSALSTLVNALFTSGGPSPQGSMRNIQLKRDGRLLTTFDLYDLLIRGDKSKDAVLQSGDVIFIPAVGPRVALAGSVENAAIYEIGNPCSLREILEDAGGLSPTAAGQHAILERVDHRSTLASQSIDLTGAGLGTPLQDGDIVSLLKLVPRFTKTVSLKGNVADPVRLPWHPGMRVSDLIPEKQALLTRDYWSEHNRLSAGLSPKTEEIHDIDTNSSAIPENEMTTRQLNKKNEYQRPAPDINWSYAAIERLDPRTLTTRLVPFNLGRAVLQHDEASDLPLEPGDIVNIFSVADFTTTVTEQSRVVRLEGEVKTAGLYSVGPGETLRELVERAGGLTSKAYLFAAEFSRESTRKEQQKRLNDYLDQTEKELRQSAVSLPGKAVNPQEENSIRENMQAQQAALERFRSVKATGRIVLDLTPDSNSIADLPEIPLEDGDRLLIPAKPATVNVMGSVYNESTFIYRAHYDLASVLRLAGGPTKFGDSARMFVIRADGSVNAKAGRRGFEHALAQPGDTIVVPESLAKVSKIRTVLDWSQILSGFGLAAAAVNVLK